MTFGRVLRWGRVGFLRRRLPYVWDVTCSPFRSALWYAKNPDMLRLVRAIDLAARSRQTVIAA